ncbi:acyl-CoA synthetase [soil metagenome]
MGDRTLDGLRQRASRVGLEARALATVARAGMLQPAAPWKLARISRALRHFGPVGGGVTSAAVQHGDRPGLIDDRGTLTFAEMEARSNALAAALADRGVEPGAGVGILCRNHRGMLDTLFACAKGGYRALLLNTDFAAPQARDVCDREGVDLLVHDQEFTDVLAEVPVASGRFVAWEDAVGEGRTGTDPAGDGTVEALIAAGDPGSRPAPPKPGSLVLLTSGTTGTPKGAARPQPRSLVLPAAFLSKIPYRSGERVYVAPPIFHAWGLANALLAVGLGSTVVTARRFDAEAVLDAVESHRCEGLVVVPVLLSRLLAEAKLALERRDLSALRIIAVSGAQLDGALATRAMDAFGDIVYNLYGSTEVAYATIATPADLRAAPGCAGRPPLGTTVRLYDDHDRPVPDGEVGRIFVSNGQSFEGYTGGGTKAVIDGLMSTGDVGHFDDDGRLFVNGRDDEMIVSGGENVFPGEVEELLAAHPAVAEAAVVGVPDEDYGQRLVAFVALRPDETLTEDGVKDHVRANLARYKVPRQVSFLDELPRNPAGKIVKHLLVEPGDGEADGAPGAPARA